MNTEPAAMSQQAEPRSSPVVAICAITFRRPEGLTRLLEGVSRLSFAGATPEVKVIVVENETQGPGAAICQDMAAEFPFPLDCAAEPRRGIPFARNLAIRRAGEVDFIAFIDDDEAPDPGWLEALLRVQADYDADLVAGPVRPVYESNPPEWIVQGGFHDRASYPTGTERSPMGTNNVLIRRAALAEMEQPFDERLALTGGTDTHLFLRLAKRGCKSVWAEEASVREWIPASRCTARWVCARAFRTGATSSIIAKDLEGAPICWARMLWRAAVHIGWGVVSLPVGLLRGRRAAMSSVKYLFRGVGVLCGLVGVQFEEYKEIHGK
jgi:glycosyltransferase involved in cell wall biosynthesis